MSLAGCQINPIDVNFYLQKVWKFLIQIQLTKSNPKITRGVKVPCLMPIRVKESVPLFSLSSQKAETEFSLNYLQMYESIQNPEDLSQSPCRSSSNRNRIQTKREIKLSISVNNLHIRSEFLTNTGLNANQKTKWLRIQHGNIVFLQNTMLVTTELTLKFEKLISTDPLW